MGPQTHPDPPRDLGCGMTPLYRLPAAPSVSLKAPTRLTLPLHLQEQNDLKFLQAELSYTPYHFGAWCSKGGEGRK